MNEKSAKGWLLTNIFKLLVHQCKHEPRCMANHVDAIGEITISTIQFLCQCNCVCSRAYIRTPGLFGMLCVFSFPINIRDCGNALCGQFFKQEKMADNCDDGDFDLPSITPKQESTCSSESIESLLGIDARISQVDRDLFLFLSVARIRHVTQLPAHIVGSLSKETRLRSREKRSHAGHFGPFAEAPRREGAKQWYRHRKKSRATELTAATSLARMAGRKAEAGLAV